uniref:Prostaglandin E synthase 3 n=1 Tax=Oncorhynchus tshawytscha TaxID=74940 RepID=A0AAZ3P8L9_ONCTS
MQPATAKWFDRRDSVFIEFLVEDSKDLKVKFEQSKLDFRCVGGIENLKHQNELDLFDSIDPNESKHKRTDRTVLCCLKKAKAGIAWPRLTKDKAKFQWLGVDFNNWKDWEDDSDEDLSSFDKFSEASKSKHVMLHKVCNVYKCVQLLYFFYFLCPNSDCCLLFSDDEHDGRRRRYARSGHGWYRRSKRARQ